MFDKLQVNESDSAIEVTDTVDSSSSNSNSGNDSPQQLQTITSIKAERPSTNHISNGKHDIDDWNSLAQFENFVKLEMENLETAAKSNQKRINNTTTTVSMTAVKNNILKPEKHVSDNGFLYVTLLLILFHYLFIYLPFI